MYDLTPLAPFVVGFLVLAAVATVLAVAGLVRVAVDLRRGRSATPVVSIAGRSPVAVVGGRAA